MTCEKDDSTPAISTPPLTGCVEVTADFLVAMMSLGDKDYAERDRQRQADKTKTKDGRTHPYRVRQEGRYENPRDREDRAVPPHANPLRWRR